jgi:hypothetical protein
MAKRRQTCGVQKHLCLGALSASLETTSFHFLPDRLNMPLASFLEKIKNNNAVSFDETIAAITENYHYQPTEFRNGLNEDALVNQAGTNEGSCKIFALAQIHRLDQQQTLNLFGDYYRLDVLNNPNRTDHQNIRNFMKYGWEGICFKGQALTRFPDRHQLNE